LSLPLHLFGSFQCGFNRVPFDGIQYFIPHSGIHTQTTKGYAAAFPTIDAFPAALIANHLGARSQVTYI
jgi:hypothetical protein